MALVFAVVPLSSTEQQWLSTGASDSNVSGVAAALRLLVFAVATQVYGQPGFCYSRQRRDEPSVTDILACDERSRIGVLGLDAKRVGVKFTIRKHLLHIQ